MKLPEYYSLCKYWSMNLRIVVKKIINALKPTCQHRSYRLY